MNEEDRCPDCHEDRVIVRHEPNGPSDYEEIAECTACGWMAST